jgi:hypothetical protein
MVEPNTWRKPGCPAAELQNTKTAPVAVAVTSAAIGVRCGSHQKSNANAAMPSASPPIKSHVSLGMRWR